MSLTFGVIDEFGRFANDAFADQPKVASDFASASSNIVFLHGFTDALFKSGWLGVSDYVDPLLILADAKPFVPIQNCDIPAIRERVICTELDARVKDTLVAFLTCSLESGLDVVFC